MASLTYQYYPPEVILHICSHLPAKSIGQYRCVSKQWRSLLSTPDFIKAYLSHCRDQSVSLYIGHLLRTCLTITHANHQLSSSHEVTASIKRLDYGNDARFHSCCNTIFGTCDGLLLVGRDGEDMTMTPEFLINPTTREMKQVPYFPFNPPGMSNVTMYGFGYDSVSDDYKILVVTYDHSALICFQKPPYAYNTDVYIYSVKNDAWKRCQTFPQDLGFVIRPNSSDVLIGNSIHWIAWKTSDISIVIAAFNVEEEKFYQMSPYTSIDHKCLFYYRLGVLGGCLCIYRERCDLKFDVWVMKEYGVHESSTELISIEPANSFKPVCLLGQQNLVLRKIEDYTCNRPKLSNSMKLVSYNLVEKTFKDVVVEGLMEHDLSFSKTFIETIVSPRLLQ